MYPGKNLGAYGDAGIITTNNYEIYRKLKKIRSLGSEKKFIHEFIGSNSRLDTIQAIILNEKIKYLDKNNSRRKIIALKYSKEIKNSKIIKLEYSKSCVYHQYVILTKKRYSRGDKREYICNFWFFQKNKLNKSDAVLKHYNNDLKKD